jgi:hypothetical protein
MTVARSTGLNNLQVGFSKRKYLYLHVKAKTSANGDLTATTRALDSERRVSMNKYLAELKATDVTTHDRKRKREEL